MERLERERLVNELALVSDEERLAIVRDARALARGSRATLPWSALRAAIGIVHGAPADAVEDTNNLYDG